MSVQLTSGAIQAIMTGNQLDQPVFQVLGQKKIAGSGGQSADRYRLLLSDGQFSHSSAMLATQLNDKVTNGELDNFAVIRLDKYLCNTIQPDRRVMILLDITVLASGQAIGEKLGSPQPFKAGAAQNNNIETPAPPKPAAAPSPQVNGGLATGSRGGFYGQQQQNKPYQAVKTSPKAPNTPGGTPAKVHPIGSLTPYQNRWTIRARVTSKSNIRTWSNSRGEGKLFSMNLLDESGEIRATLFRDQVDKFYDMVEPNKVYYISKATLKTADKRYSSLNNDYEMTFNNDTTMIPCEEDCNLPTLSFNFVPINQLDKHEANSLIDIIGVVKTTADLSTVMGRQSNREIKKRDVHLVDENKVQVRMTLWGDDAEKFDGSDNPVLAVKGARLSDFGGRSLSCVSSSQLVKNPDIPESHRLRGWFDNIGHSLDYEEYRNEGGLGAGGSGGATNWKMLAQVKEEGLGQGEKGDYFTAKGTVIFLKKDNCMYQACPSADCNKKVIDQGNGTYRCEKCQKETPDFKWRMILNANIADFTDHQWVTCFQDTAEVLLGRSAQAVANARDTNENEFDQVFQEGNFKSYIFKCRAKQETYNEETRLKTICVQATPIDWKDYNKKLIIDIEKLLSA